MADKEFSNFVTGLFFFTAIVGALLLLVVPKGDEYRRRLGIAFFTCGMGGIAVMFLSANPDVLAQARDHIGLALIGMVIAFFSVIRSLRH